MPDPQIYIGVDTGGTFTDFLVWDGERYFTRKVRSTPDDPARAILEGLRDLAPSEVVHGSTVATNALLERKGARTAFVTTEGFEDILLIGRQNRPELYNFLADVRVPVVPSDLTFGAPERTLHDGSVERELTEPDAEDLARRVRDAGAESVAVCLLHSYANPAHERLLGEKLDGLFVSLSHEILPEYREYERASTTVVNAAVSPLMDRYLRRLDEKLAASRLRVFQSNGGSISARGAGRNAIHTVLSGPAGGVIGAAAVGRAAGFDKIISFDMGGTSTDVSLYDGGFAYTTESRIGDFPVRVPMLDIHTVGAGGRFDRIPRRGRCAPSRSAQRRREARSRLLRRRRRDHRHRREPASQPSRSGGVSRRAHAVGHRPCPQPHEGLRRSRRRIAQLGCGSHRAGRELQHGARDSRHLGRTRT